MIYRPWARSSQVDIFMLVFTRPVIFGGTFVLCLAFAAWLAWPRHSRA